TLTATNQLYDKSNSFVGLRFAILAAIFWGLEGVIYKMLLNANIAINTLLFLRKISTIIIFLPFTWAIIHSVNISILPLTLAIGIIGYIADLAYMKAFKHSNVTLAMSLNITYIIWGPLFALLLFDQ
ncbi:EamA family transporter, partial [Francisella tularensis]|uniref:EamA family transporter n=1 Tax=Francisella tularensis TaxID=263 RepID=UPI001681B4B7